MQLRELTRAYGHQWARMSQAWRGRKMTANALRIEAKKLRANESEAESESSEAPPSSCNGDARKNAETSDSRVAAALATLERMEVYVRKARKRTSRNCPTIPGVQLRTLPLVEHTAALRTDWCGRGWTHAVYSTLRRECITGQELVERRMLPGHEWLVQALQLHHATAPYKLLYCDLVRARRLWSGHLEKTMTKSAALVVMQSTTISLELRGSLRIVQHADGCATRLASPLPTLLACGHKRVVIGGTDSSGVHYVGPRYAMAWMGMSAAIGRCSTTVAQAQECFKAQALTRAIGNAIALPVAIAGIAGAFSAAEWEPSGRVTYASLYAGGFDTFLRALRWLQANVWTCMLAVPIFAAEKDAGCRRMLRRTEAYGKIYRTAERAAKLAEGQVGLLTSSPECKRFSAGALLGGCPTTVVRKRAVREGRKTTAVLAQTIARTRPRVVLQEQVVGVVSHHAAVLKAQLRVLRKRCPEYHWYGRILDATRLRAPHRRVRLLVAGALASSMSGKRQRSTSEAKAHRAPRTAAREER